MSGIKHSVIKSRMLAIIFLLLNAVCIASPVIKNTADDFNQAISLPFGHNANSSETEENQLPNSSFINYHLQRSVVSENPNGKANFNGNVPALFAKKWFKYSLTGSDFLPKPDYYNCLFLYTLF